MADRQDELVSRYRELETLGTAVCKSLGEQVEKLGFSLDEVKIASIDRARFELSRDPYTGLNSLHGIWSDANERRVGSIVFHADGSFFAEYDVIKPHPTNKRWFVEAVTAWGRDDVVKAEPRLLPAVT